MTLRTQHLDERAIALLKQRARELESRTVKCELDDELVAQVVEVRRAGTLWGLPVDHVREVRRATLFALPGASGALRGLFHIRGRCHCLADLAALGGTAPHVAHGEAVLAALIEVGTRSLGLAIDEVVRTRDIRKSQIGEGLQPENLPFVTWVTRDLLNIIDVQGLFDHEGISPQARER